MKISDFATESEFEKLKSYMPHLEYTKEYADDEIDILDENLDKLEEDLGYTETEEGTFIGNMIDKLRNNPKY
ncbi:hypothetical protein [Ligilactobacillus equi]